MYNPCRVTRWFNINIRATQPIIRQYHLQYRGSVLTMAKWTMGTTLIHQSPCSECDLHQASRENLLISIPAFRSSSLKKTALSLCSPLQGRLSRSSLWSEKVLNLGASFSIFCFSPDPISSCMNNAEDLVARGAMGDGFTQSPLPGAITSEGKSSQDTSCSPIGSPVAGQRSYVNNQLYFFPCDGPRGNQLLRPDVGGGHL